MRSPRTAMKSNCCSQQLNKACAAATKTQCSQKNKLIKLKKKKKKKDSTLPRQGARV